MLDTRVVDFLRASHGGRIRPEKRKRASYQRIYSRWTLVCKHAAVFLVRILPYLQLKKRQAELAIEFQGRLIGTKGRGRGMGREQLSETEIKHREDLEKQISNLNGHKSFGVGEVATQAN